MCSDDRHRRAVAVDTPETGSLADLLAAPGMADTSALTFVTAADGPPAAAVQTLSRAGWHEARRRVALWPDVDLIGYRRQTR